MLLPPSVVILLVIHLVGLSARPLAGFEDDGQYRPMPGEDGPMAGDDGDNGMYHGDNYGPMNTRPEENRYTPSGTRPEETNDTPSEAVAGETNDTPSETKAEEINDTPSENKDGENNDTSSTNTLNEGNPDSNEIEGNDGNTENLSSNQRDTNSGNTKGGKVVCYFEDWAKSRPGKGSFGEEEMLNAACTHVIYSFATLDASSNKIQYPFTPTAIQKLKAKGVKAMLAIGGANDSHGKKYSTMAGSPENRKVFIDSVLEVMKQHDFDGFDVDWEYPTCPAGSDSCGSSPEDKDNFVQLIAELRKALPGKVLTIATHAGKNVVDKAYDLPALHGNLDWINVMTYDLHGSWEQEALNHSPLKASGGGLSTDSAVQLYKGAGVPAEKIVIGVPTYGRSLKLVDQAKHEYNAPVAGGGEAGPYTREAGMLGYLEICEKVKTSGWKVGGATDDVGPYAYNGDQFVGFDDTKTAERKAKYAQEQGLGGVMVWALGTDDFGDVCGCGKYPIISALNSVLVKGTAAAECSL